MSVTVARVYDPPTADRVFVDRLWPRGIRKDDPRIGRWCKDVAPSNELRSWYHANRDQYEVFAARYREELTGGPAASALGELRELASAGDVEIATAAKDVEHSHVPVIVAALRSS
ncbi:Uncharacterized conserved protein YeaO, DUF488 family [Gordonia malaquae]|uniref:MarR family transcriptional regulator n=1 Tax=Gordonia malaquae NBRC 108250 TaxID=1223542 RepID=M3VCW9_GORML|nr:DUF488 family protein [Gordonia malaquae]GAC77979.1 hypothetical protein GM1_001_01040 [Gordonia malaquae NBRC 108250]SED87497.1 Uncharacterized conserved protein YeaO, DUF488 family [Gordonia malaquae]